MNKQDLTQYSDNELSLVVMNDEWLYSMRRRILRGPDGFLSDFFIYTDEQLETLIADIKEDLGE